jgi:hypothetical protein
MANFRFRNAWSDAARTDARFRDPTSTLEALAPAAELVDLAAAADGTEPPSAGPETHHRIIAESWGNWWKRGAEHSQARLSEDDVREIRRLHAEGLGYRRLGRRYGVHHQTVQAIISGRSWSHVT